MLAQGLRKVLGGFEYTHTDTGMIASNRTETKKPCVSLRKHRVFIERLRWELNPRWRICNPPLTNENTGDHDTPQQIQQQLEWMASTNAAIANTRLHQLVVMYLQADDQQRAAILNAATRIVATENAQVECGRSK